jgi:O-methyltransferase domain/Dimerisation domain
MDATITTADHLMQLGHAFKGAKALLSAVELGVFTILSEGSLDADALRRRTGIDARGARDFFDALVALELLERDGKDRYANTRETDLYLDSTKPSYIGGDLEHLNARVYPHWSDLTAALQTGRPQSGARGTGNYPALYSDPAAFKTFMSGMTDGCLSAAKAAALMFPWHQYSTVIDIGAAQGGFLVQIAARHAHISGGGFDLAPIKPLFDRYVQAHGLATRLKFNAGDFFTDKLPTADVLVMGRILHNWDLVTKRMLLRKAHDALAPGGALMVYERLIDDDRRTSTAGLLASLNMLIMTQGGFDFTGKDCVGWMREAGFQSISISSLANDISMVVGLKRAKAN